MFIRLVLLIVLLALLIGAGLATSAAQAAEDLAIFGDVYSRWDGFRDLDANSALDDNYSLTSMRTRLGCRAWIGSRAIWEATLENARDLGSHSESDEVFVHEAHLVLRDLFISGLDASLGRHSLAYGNERIIGPQDWTLARVGQHRFDGLVAHYEFDDGWVDLLSLKLNESGGDWRLDSVEDDNYSQSPWFQKGDVDLNGIYGHYNLGESFFIEPYFLASRTVNHGSFACQQFPVTIDVNIGDPDLDTTNYLGALVDYENDAGLKAWGELLITRGDLHSPRIDSLSTVGEYLVDGVETAESAALAFYGGVTYTADTKLKPWIGLEYDYASGHDGGDKDRTFRGLSGSFNDYHGASDVVGWSNTSSYCFKGGVAPRENLSLGMEYWYFRLASDKDTAYAADGSPLAAALNDDGVYEEQVGNEFTLYLDYDYAEDVGMVAGFTVFSQGNYFGSDESDAIVVGWLGARLTFER